MRRAICSIFYAAALLCALPGCTSLYFQDAGAPSSPPPRYTLEHWPYSEYWTGIILPCFRQMDRRMVSMGQE